MAAELTATTPTRNEPQALSGSGRITYPGEKRAAEHCTAHTGMRLWKKFKFCTAACSALHRQAWCHPTPNNRPTVLSAVEIAGGPSSFPTPAKLVAWTSASFFRATFCVGVV